MMLRFTFKTLNTFTLSVVSAVIFTAVSANADQKLSVSKSCPATVVRGGKITQVITIKNNSKHTLTKGWTADAFLNGKNYLPYIPGETTPGCSHVDQWIICPPDKKGVLNGYESKTYNITYSVPGHIPCDTVLVSQSDVYGNPSEPDWAKCYTKVVCPPPPTPTSAPTSTPRPKYQCEDGIDNDGDGWIDMDDECCPNPQGNDEGHCNKPKIDIVKSGAATIYKGEVIVYTITIKNISKINVPDAQVFDAFISGTAFTYIPEQSTPGCAVSGEYVACPKTALAPNESKSYNLAFKVPSTAVCNEQVMDRADVQFNGKSVNWAKFVTTVKCNVTSPILPISECVYNLGAGKYRAYFGYENTGNKDVTITAGVDTSDEVNAFTGGSANRGQPSIFQTGKKTAVFTVDFNAAESLTWNVKPKDGDLKTITVSKDSKYCKPVSPIAECRDSKPNNKFFNLFGYRNDNPFTIKLSIPQENKFAPQPEDRAQPNEFLSGRVQNAFSITSDTDLTWTLATESSSTNNNLPRCTPNSTPVCKINATPLTQCQGTQTRVDLDGSQSTDVDGNPLTYKWTSDCTSASFSDPTAAQPDLIVDTSNGQAKICKVKLVVNDGTVDSTGCEQQIKISACDLDCAGNPNGSAKPDLCGVCNGNNACVDCTGLPNGGTKVDKCGVCGGNNACVDCKGVVNGTAKLDKCGVCEGDDKSCLECTTTDIKDKILALDIAVAQLKNLIIRLTNRLQSLTENDPKYDALVLQARKEAELQYEQAWVLVWTQFKLIIINCADSSGACQEVDQSASINAYTAASTKLRDTALGLLRQIQNIRNKKDKVKVQRDKQLEQTANQLFNDSANLLKTIPRFNSVCR